MKGTFFTDLHCPACGAVFPNKVRVDWWTDPGSRLDPPDQGIEIPNPPEACPSCNSRFSDDDFEKMHDEAEAKDWTDGEDEPKEWDWELEVPDQEPEE